MKKILIVDDRLEVRRLVEITLSVENYRIIQAESGREAINIVKAEKPDLIIMDISMPGEIDGLEATRILKNDPGSMLDVHFLIYSIFIFQNNSVWYKCNL